MRSIEESIGRTPLVQLKTPPSSAEIWAKVEAANPGGSVKDRIALAMIDDAVERGVLKPGGTVVEATSGNTGIGLAVVCAVREYPLVLVLPESMSRERLAAAEALGARVVTTAVELGMRGSIEEAERLAEQEGAFWPKQFENPANPAVHERTTGPEIVRGLGAKVDAFVAGVGTGGTITGVGRYLKGLDPSTQLIAVEPASSAVLSGREAGPHRIQGIGAGFVPAVLDTSLLDGIEPIDDIEAWEVSREVARTDGLFVGVSAGAALVGARRVAERLGAGKKVVTVLPDTGERYLSLAPYFQL
jgi:cysteine synthase A